MPTDLLAVKEAIDSGATDLEIAEAHFGSYCRFHRAFTNYRRLKQTAKDWKTEVYVLYGPPVRVSHAIAKTTPVTPIGNK